MADRTLVDQLLDRWEEARERGESLSAEELCREHPELLDSVREKLSALSALDHRLADENDTDPAPSGDAATVSLDNGVPKAAQHATGGITRLGKYEVVQVLGEGGQGSAVLALDPDLQRRVVIKQYHMTGRGSDQEILFSEGRALCRVDSPFVARCLGVERADGTAYLVVEYVPGTTLKERHERQPLSFTEAARVVEQAASGVAAIHTAGLLHRDIKPANIILGEDGVPKLVDFGLATPVASESLHQVAGTLAYMAPEQARGEGERIDPRTDVFALGAVLYQLLTGQPPYRASTPLNVLEQAKQARYERPRSVNPSIPRRLERICLRAMAGSPKQRYASAESLAGALRRYRQVPLITVTIATAAIALLSAVLLWRPWQESSASPVPSSTEELRGELIASFWSPDGSKRGLRVNEPGALPARAGELVHLEARFNRPAYAYLLWIDGQGQVYLLHPWNKILDMKAVPLSYADSLTSVPELYRSLVPVAVLHEPPQYDHGLELGGNAGLETVVLLARRLPVPSDLPLANLVKEIAPSPFRDPHEYAMINLDAPSEEPAVGRHRGINPSETKAIDDPLLQLLERLRPHFEVIRAVRFAYAGE